MEEHLKFMQAYAMCNKDWDFIAEMVGTRDAIQVKSHHQTWRDLLSQTRFSLFSRKFE